MVSIIIPVLNEAAAIGGTLENVLSLDGNFEIIVVDGGSSDGTPDIARRYARVLHSPRGRAKQMNSGAAQAKGDILLFLHADTVLPQAAISAVEMSLADLSVVGGRFKIRLDNPRWPYRMVGLSINFRDSIFKGFTGDQAIFVRSEVFRALGGYREVALMEDLDLGKRMARAGKIGVIPLKVTTSARRWEKGGVFKTILLMWTLRLLYVLHYPPSKLKRFYGDTR